MIYEHWMSNWGYSQLNVTVNLSSGVIDFIASGLSRTIFGGCVCLLEASLRLQHVQCSVHRSRISSAILLRYCLGWVPWMTPTARFSFPCYTVSWILTTGWHWEEWVTWQLVVVVVGVVDGVVLAWEKTQAVTWQLLPCHQNLWGAGWVISK